MCTKLKIIDLSFYRQATISCLCNLKFPFCQLNNQLATVSQYRCIFRLFAVRILSFFIRFLKKLCSALKQMGLGVNCTVISSPNTYTNAFTNILQSTSFTFISSSYALPYNVSARDVVLRNTSHTKFTASDFTAVVVSTFCYLSTLIWVNNATWLRNKMFSMVNFKKGKHCLFG